MSSNIKNHQIIVRNRNRNKRYKLAIKRAIKQYLLSLQNNELESQNDLNNTSLCLNNLSIVYKRIDKAVKRKVLHRNTAARKKSRLAKILK
uniref:Ribosomal protein S20 n=1 Tax=Chondria sp. (in: red algae) TaxID=1982705 RepID=A0A1Z1MRC7_9FLOR|nr:ribosomal protein S20 [Chondria sp. (in: red algae)]